jgi:hypothetical protein
MLLSNHPRHRSGTFSTRSLLVCFVAFSLVASLALPSHRLSLETKDKIVKAHVPLAKKQRLNQDARPFVVPAPVSTFLTSSLDNHHPATREWPTQLHFDGDLYNRPPPSC